MREDALFVAVGGQVAALTVPSLELRWAVEVESACILALHDLSGADALLVRGEIEITRLGLDGHAHWQRGGTDIFTGGCSVEGDEVVAVDWGGARYRWRLSDGQLLAETPGNG